MKFIVYILIYFFFLRRASVAKLWRTDTRGRNTTTHRIIYRHVGSLWRHVGCFWRQAVLYASPSSSSPSSSSCCLRRDDVIGLLPAPLEVRKTWYDIQEMNSNISTYINHFMMPSKYMLPSRNDLNNFRYWKTCWDASVFEKEGAKFEKWRRGKLEKWMRGKLGKG